MNDGCGQTKVGVIGLGHWGPNHVRVFSTLPVSTVVAVADVDPARVQRVQQSSPGIRAFRTAAALMAESDVEAVVIATPTATHYALVKAALAAGKHVLCEKPLCLTSAEADELTALAARAQRTLMVGHVFLFNPALNQMYEMLAAGEIGTPQYLAAVRTNLGPIRSDVNAAWDLASHDISIFNWLLGCEPEDVVAMGASFLQPGKDDVVNISLRYPGNVLATVLCSWLDPKKVRQVTLVGTRKMATWDDLNLTTPVAVYEKGARVDLDVADYGQFLRFSMWDGDIRLPKIPQGEPLRLQAEYFLKAIDNPALRRSDGAFGAGVVRALEMVSAALQQSARVAATADA